MQNYDIFIHIFNYDTDHSKYGFMNLHLQEKLEEPRSMGKVNLAVT